MSFVAPTAALAVPTPHDEHASAAARAWYLPAGQFSHALRAVLLAKRPAAQSAHDPREHPRAQSGIPAAAPLAQLPHVSYSDHCAAASTVGAVSTACWQPLAAATAAHVAVHCARGVPRAAMRQPCAHDSRPLVPFSHGIDCAAQADTHMARECAGRPPCVPAAHSHRVSAAPLICRSGHDLQPPVP